jgi:hypothetical protein
MGTAQGATPAREPAPTAGAVAVGRPALPDVHRSVSPVRRLVVAAAVVVAIGAGSYATMRSLDRAGPSAAIPEPQPTPAPAPADPQDAQGTIGRTTDEVGSTRESDIRSAESSAERSLRAESMADAEAALARGDLEGAVRLLSRELESTYPSRRAPQLLAKALETAYGRTEAARQAAAARAEGAVIQ